MNDEDSTDRPDAGSLTAMYLETLRLRMEPEKFGALADALKGFKKASEAGFDRAGFEVDEELFTDDVRRELAAVLTMAATGRTDDRVVEIVEGDPSMGWVVVTAEVADDQGKLAELREQMLCMVEEAGVTIGCPSRPLARGDGALGRWKVTIDRRLTALPSILGA